MHLLNPSLSEATSAQIEEHARRFVDNAPCGYLITDRDGKLLMINEMLLEWLQYGPEEMPADTSFPDLLTPAGRIYYDTHLFPLLKLQGRVREISLSFLRRDGSELPVLLSAYAREDAGDAHGLVSLVVTNFSDRKQYEKELLKARQAAESSLEAKTSFLSTISHEVLTPLNAIIGTADLLSVTELDPHQERLQQIMVESGNHLLSLFKNILIVARNGLEGLEVNLTEFSARRMVNAIIDSYRYGRPDESVTYEVQVDEDVPDLLLGDVTLLTQVMTNLISNATKFTRGGRVSVRVDCLKPVSEQEYLIRFSVTDNGIGIPEANLPALFEPFSQANRDVHLEYGGSGLGLSICENILSAFQSRLQVESSVGHGSRFWFDIALPRVEIQPSNGGSVGELPVIGHGRVLIVEDNPTNSFLVARYLRRWQVDFELATNGKKALQMVTDQGFDLVLMDLKMPVMDGYTSAREIRKLPSPKSDVPIIAFSASARTAMTDRMRDAHIDGFTLKPFDPRQLHAILLRFLSPSPMNFSELRDAMDHDPEELNSFSAILRRELTTAAEDLRVAFERNDADRVADLKHKLKTSLQLLEAHTLKQDLQQAVEDMRAGRPTANGVETVIVEEMLHLTRRLSRERW